MQFTKEQLQLLVYLLDQEILRKKSSSKDKLIIKELMPKLLEKLNEH